MTNLNTEDGNSTPQPSWEPLHSKYSEELPFKWQQMPSEYCGSKPPAFMPAESFIVAGKRARLDKLIQSATYGGVLCGIPHSPETNILGAVKYAKSAFPWFTAKPFVVPPPIRFGESGGLPWAVLPAVSTIALFCDGSDMALVIWFQDSYGLPSDQRVVDLLATIDMKIHGMEWEP